MRGVSGNQDAYVEMQIEQHFRHYVTVHWQISNAALL